MAPLFIESAAMRVGVLPDYGGRVVSLVDKASGRDWIAPGPPSPNTGEDAVFGAAEAVGWDECFPTVAPWDATEAFWRRPLRDHGDLWGRPCRLDAHTDSSIALAIDGDDVRFARTLSVAGPVLTATYIVDNLAGADDLPYLWSLHGLLAVDPADRIVLPGIDSLAATYLSLAGRDIAAETVAWPETNGVLPFPLDRVQPAGAGFAGKFYAELPGPARAAIGHDRQWLVVGWDAAIPALGLWLNYGGWPSPPGTWHVALEPTTAPVDHLGQALDSGRAGWVRPGHSASWTVTLTLAEDPP